MFGISIFGEEMCVDGYKTNLGFNTDNNIVIILQTPAGEMRVAVIGPASAFDTVDLMRLQAQTTLEQAEKKSGRGRV